MNRLQAQLQRLYALQVREDGQRSGSGHRPPSAAGTGTRLMVLELALPPSWDALGPVWQGVQADLELPAPAIAVSGLDGYQLWFGLDAPLPHAEALAFMQGLRRRYLADVARERVRMHVRAEASCASTPGESPGACVAPPTQRASGGWSAFLAPDLAALFVDEPWLDSAPSADAQADLLSRLQPAPLADLRRALGRLTLAAPRPASEPMPVITESVPGDAEAGPSNPATPSPERFLLGIMNDPGVDLLLRIEAAKALLPYYPPGAGQ